MEHHFVQRVSRLFPSSFTSCRFRTVPDVVESSIPITKILHDSNNIGAPQPFSTICRSPFLSRQPAAARGQDRRHKMLENENRNFKKKLQLSGSDNEGRKCPPVTPVSVLPPPPPKEPTNKTTTNATNMSCSSNSTTGGWFSSSSDDEEREVGGESDAIFSLSSSCNSSESFRLKIDNSTTTDQLGRCLSGISTKSANSTVFSHRTLQPTKKTPSENPPPAGGIKQRNNHNHTQESEILKGCKVVESSTELYYGTSSTTTSHCRPKTAKKNRRSRNTPPPASAGGYKYSAGYVSGQRCGTPSTRIEESYAVEKSSDDPHGDFRTSMLEMIIEKQIFCAEDLERLLFCFLSLNSPHYHRIIVEVFTEICDTLFSN